LESMNSLGLSPNSSHARRLGNFAVGREARLAWYRVEIYTGSKRWESGDLEMDGDPRLQSEQLDLHGCRERAFGGSIGS